MNDLTTEKAWIDAADALAKRMWRDLLPRMSGRFERDEWFQSVTGWPEFTRLVEVDDALGADHRPWMRLNRFRRALVQLVIDDR